MNKQADASAAERVNNQPETDNQKSEKEKPHFPVIQRVLAPFQHEFGDVPLRSPFF